MSDKIYDAGSLPEMVVRPVHPKYYPTTLLGFINKMWDKILHNDKIYGNTPSLILPDNRSSSQKKFRNL